MYYQHFGLSGPPFQFTPSPKVLYMSNAHREAMAALEWGLLHEPSGFTVLVGETGTGKTTLICSLLMRHYDLVRTAYVANPKLGFDEMARVLMRQLGIHARQGRLNTVDAFNRFLSQLQVGERVVVIVDEAQGLSDEALEELRLFSNAGQREEKQLHFVLVGQPELMKRLSQHSLRQFNERIGARAILNPLSREEAFAYVDYRLSAHEGTAKRIFGRGALEYLIDHSGGIPRRINVLCHNAMLLAYSAGTNQIDFGAARAAVAEFEDLFTSARHFNPAVPAWIKPMRIAGAALAIAAVAIFAAGATWFWFAPSHREDPLVNFTKSAAAAPSVEKSGPHGQAANDPPAPSKPTEQSGDAVAGNSSAHPRPEMYLGGAAENGSGVAAAAEIDPKSVQDADSHPEKSSQVTAAADHTDTAKAAAPNPASIRQVRVKHGDTLALIAIRYLGSEGQLGNLINANPQLSNVDMIYPGQIIHLPAAGASTPQE
jgi:type II secretory pathway predicted ATPase ExeA/LysM repeat protein